MKAPLSNNEIKDLVGDQETGAFHVMNEGFTQPDVVYPIMSEVDGDKIHVWYSNGQIVELTAKWSQLPMDHQYFTMMKD